MNTNMDIIRTCLYTINANLYIIRTYMYTINTNMYILRTWHPLSCVYVAIHL